VELGHYPDVYDVPNNPLCDDRSNGQEGVLNAILSCPPGKMAISGAYFGLESADQAPPAQMSPTTDGTGYWFIQATGGARTIIFVTCASASP